MENHCDKREQEKIVLYALTYGLIGGFAIGVYLMSVLKKVNEDHLK